MARRNAPHIRKFKFQANLRWLLSNLEGGEETCVSVLREVPEDDADYDTIQTVLDHWDRQDSGKQKSLDLACSECKVQGSMLYGWFAKRGYEIGLNMMRVQLAAASPAIMQAAIDKALAPDGTVDRKMLFEAIGLLQGKKTVNQAMFVNNPPADDGATDTTTFEHGQRDVSARLRDGRPKQIPATIDVKVPH